MQIVVSLRDLVPQDGPELTQGIAEGFIVVGVVDFFLGVVVRRAARPEQTFQVFIHGQWLLLRLVQRRLTEPN